MNPSFQIEPTNKKQRLLHDHHNHDHDQQDYTNDSFELHNLPRDILFIILTKLPISSLIQFRLVCKSWKLLSMDPDLAGLHHTAVANNDPTLLFHCDYPIGNKLCFVDLSSNDENKTVRKITTPFCNSMPEFSVVGSCNGLLCLSDSFYGEPVYVFNPFTREYLELPKTKQFDEQDVMLGFGFHPVTKEYKLVKIVYYRNSNGKRRVIRNNRNYTKSEVQVITISKEMSKNCWRSLGKMNYQIDIQSKDQVPLVNGRIHWLSKPGKISGRSIISFDLKDEKFDVVVKPTHIRSNYHLVVVRGCLAAVTSCGNGKLEIWVMKEYGENESWIKELVIHGANPAKVLSHEYRHYGIWKRALTGRLVRVLCVLKNGEILLEYRGGKLVKYDPIWKEFKDVVFAKMPKLFQTIVHVGTLNWVNTSL